MAGIDRRTGRVAAIDAGAVPVSPAGPGACCTTLGCGGPEVSFAVQPLNVATNTAQATRAADRPLPDERRQRPVDVMLNDMFGS